jgi:hypothetical protein
LVKSARPKGVASPNADRASGLARQANILAGPIKDKGDAAPNVMSDPNPSGANRKPSLCREEVSGNMIVPRETDIHATGPRGERTPAIMHDRIRSGVLRRLFQYWDEKRGDRRAPSRGDIDPAEMIEALPNVFLIDVLAEPRRYRVRLMGTVLGDWYGQDLTGRYVDEITDQVVGALHELVTTWRPWRLLGECGRRSAGTKPYELLALPLSTDGTTVNMVLGGIAQVHPED